MFIVGIHCQFVNGELRSMPNLATILQLKAWQNCPTTLDVENIVKSTFSGIYDSVW